MKIEKISDNQIRCTLTHSDLESRELKLSELAYGTEKAKHLFQDMIEQASNDFGFVANEAPLMIEAIPMSPDCIVLVITRVDDPEELDNRFMKVTGSPSDDSEEDFDEFEELLNQSAGFPDSTDTTAEADNFIPMSETLGISGDKTGPEADFTIVYCLYSFKNWEDVSEAARLINKTLFDESILFKDQSDAYHLYMTAHVKDEKSLSDALELLSEYGHKEKANYATPLFLSEHYDTIIKRNALSILSQY